MFLKSTGIAAKLRSVTDVIKRRMSHQYTQRTHVYTAPIIQMQLQEECPDLFTMIPISFALLGSNSSWFAFCWWAADEQQPLCHPLSLHPSHLRHQHNRKTHSPSASSDKNVPQGHDCIRELAFQTSYCENRFSTDRVLKQILPQQTPTYGGF